jgi:hypothetical protein
MTQPHQGLGERVADAARHVIDALERDVESLAILTPAESIAETTAAADGATPQELADQPPAAVRVANRVEPMTAADLDAGTEQA